MQTRDIPTELLVPPRRLGQLLSSARVQGGFSLDEAALAMGPNWSSLALLEIETGHRPVLEEDLATLTKLYRIPTTTLIPTRSHLMLDLDEGVLEVGHQRARLDGEVVERRDVLTRYLSMVYAMRGARPGQAVPLRLPDLEVLSGVLGAPRRQLEDELRSMMVKNSDVLGQRTRGLKGRLLIPVIGVVVAVTAVGTLLLVSNDSDAVTSSGGATPTTIVADPGTATTTVDGTAGATTDIGDAAVQERLPDGSPGPVTTRD